MSSAPTLPHIDSMTFGEADIVCFVSKRQLDPSIHTIIATAEGMVTGSIYAISTDGSSSWVYIPDQHTLVFVPDTDPHPPNSLLVSSNVAACDTGYLVRTSEPPQVAAAASSASASASSAGKRRKAPVKAQIVDGESSDEEGKPLRIQKRRKAPAAPKEIALFVKGKGKVRKEKITEVIQTVVSILGMTSQYKVTDSGGSYDDLSDPSACVTFDTQIGILRHIKDTFNIDVTHDLATSPSSLFAGVLSLDDTVFE